MPFIKLKSSPNSSTILEFFDVLPSWENLSSKIANIFNIPPSNVGVAYVQDRESITLINDQGLQQYFSDKSCQEFKFVVQDLHRPGLATTIASTWSADSNLSAYESAAVRPVIGLGNHIKLFCLLLAPDNPIFSVDIDKNLTVDDLRVEIKKKMEASFPHYELSLWQMNPPMPSTNIGQPQSPEDIEGCIKLHPTSMLSAQFPSPLGLDIHVAVMHIPSKKRPRSPAAEESEGSKRIHTDQPANLRREPSPPPQSPGNVVPRSETVAALYQRLQAYHFIQVRGTPGSGKTTLGLLLANHIRKMDKNAHVIWVSRWPAAKVEKAHGYRRYLRDEMNWVEGNNTVFIFDEGQATYWDKDLWNDFFKNFKSYRDRKAVLFSSYGSPSSLMLIGEGTTTHLKDEQRVSLKTIAHDDDLPPVGLLFTRDELDELVAVSYPRSTHYFHESFFRLLFLLTAGHVGAVSEFLTVITVHDSYRRLKESDDLYTWDIFSRMVGPRDFFQKLAGASAFVRGLPESKDLQIVAVAEVFSRALRNGYVTKADFINDSALLHCFRSGWLQADKIGIGTKETVAYFFASPLHRWYVEWKLWDNYPAPPIEIGDILPFVIQVIRKFSPKRFATERNLSSGENQAIPEYQDEFYKSCSDTIVTFPEYGTGEGRADFYIPAKAWGVELLRDGDRLAEHSGRFSQQGSYATNLALSDYIILDCRTKYPRDPHPDLRNLYHVVFTDNFTKVSVLTNTLVTVDTFQLLSGSA